jgi:magnesium-transporting ATPase (P-type)
MGLAGFLFFDWCLAQGWSEAAARNALLLLMVLFENVHIFNCRSESRSVFRVPLAANPWLISAVLAAQAAHLSVMYVPGFFNEVLGAAPVDGATWLLVTALALSLVLVMEVYKRVRATQFV